jgi:hypothetical protein
MSALTTSLALRAAINVLHDSAESRRMPSGEPLDGNCTSTLRRPLKSLCRTFVITSRNSKSHDEKRQ